MNVLMLSLDHKTLLYDQVQDGSASQGDTADRQRKYGALVEDLDIVVTSPPGFEAEQLSDTVSVYPTNKKSFIGHGLVALKQAKKKKYDVIVAQDLTAPAAWLISKLTKIPYIITFHGADFNNADFSQKKADRFLKPAIKYAVTHAHGLRVVSPAVKKNFESMGVTLPIEVIPTAADYSLFMQESSHTGNGKTILADGRLEEVKNYPLLFKAFQKVLKEIPNAHLNIVGTGTQEAHIKKLAYDMHLSNHVTFLGGMAYEDLVPHYQSCDVFALASDSESLGKVLLQAGAAGKPVVSTNTFGPSGIVKDGETGFLVPVGNANMLAEKILLLLNDKELRETLGAAGKEQVMSEYDSEKNIKKFVDFWKSIAK